MRSWWRPKPIDSLDPDLRHATTAELRGEHDTTRQQLYLMAQRIDAANESLDKLKHELAANIAVSAEGIHSRIDALIASINKLLAGGGQAQTDDQMRNLAMQWAIKMHGEQSTNLPAILLAASGIYDFLKGAQTVNGTSIH